MNLKTLKSLNTQMIVCQDGPLRGETLRFSINGTTLEFTVKGHTGYYKQGVWHEVQKH